MKSSYIISLSCLAWTTVRVLTTSPSVPTSHHSSVLEGRTDSWQKINFQGILILKEYASGNKYGVNIRVALRDVCDRSPGLCDYNEFVS
jgi:hypothetical protein